MKGWQFDRAVDLLITQHVLEAGDEIAKILIKASCMLPDMSEIIPQAIFTHSCSTD